MVSRTRGASDDQALLVIWCLVANEWCPQAGFVHSVKEKHQDWGLLAKRDGVNILFLLNIYLQAFTASQD